MRPTDEPPALLSLEIEGLLSDGRGLSARRPGEKIVFVRGALPGETVLARLTGEKKSFREAETVEILSPSPRAVPAPCPLARDCGGCPLMRLDYGEQLVWKERFVRDALTRLGGVTDPPLKPVLPSPATLAFRNRMELAAGLDEDGRPRLGFRRPASHRIVPAAACRLLPPGAGELVADLEDALRAEGFSVHDGRSGEKEGRRGSRARPGFLRFCQIRLGRVPDRESLASAAHVPEKEGFWLVLLTSPGTGREEAALRRLALDMLERHPGLQAVIHEVRRAPDRLVRGEARRFALGRADAEWDPALMIMPLLDRGYLVDAADFFQVNGGAADLLVREARDLLPPGPLLDLYCGSGAPGLSLGAGPVTGLEYSPSAAALARRNAARFGVRARYLAGDAARLLADPGRIPAGAEQVLCDPPRGGLAPEALAFLRKNPPRRLLYISCSPATLARDIRALADVLSLAAARPVDLFPHTPHVETVCLLTRSSS